MRKLILVLALIISWLGPVFAPPKGISFPAPLVGSISVAIFPKENEEHALFNGKIIVVSRSSGEGDKQSLTATADPKGYYVVTSLLEGPYTIIASAPGYKTSKKNVAVKKYHKTDVNVILIRN